MKWWIILNNMLIKNYIVEVDDEKFKEYIEMKLNEYLELAGYFDK